MASVAIRTATVSDGRAAYGAGGAVTLLSGTDEEAEETIVKGAALPDRDEREARRVVDAAVYETLLIEDGRVRLAERHLARLARTGVPERVLREVAAGKLARACRAAGRPTVVRVDVAADGTVTSATRRRSPRRRCGCCRSWATTRERPARAEAGRPLVGRRAGGGRGGGLDEPLLLSPRASWARRAAPTSSWWPGTALSRGAQGLLPGVTRSWLLDRERVATRIVRLDELLAGDITTAGRGVVRVAAIGDVELADDPRAERQQAWRAL